MTVGILTDTLLNLLHLNLFLQRTSFFYIRMFYNILKNGVGREKHLIMKIEFIVINMRNQRMEIIMQSSLRFTEDLRNKAIYGIVKTAGDYTVRCFFF